MTLHKLLGVGPSICFATFFFVQHFLCHSRRAGQTWKGNSGQIQIKTFWEHSEAWIPEGGPAPGQVSGQEGTPETPEAGVPVTLGVLRSWSQPQQPGGDQDLQTAGEQAAAGAQHQAGGAHRQGNNPWNAQIIWEFTL